jgi:hypothetical protein
MHTLTIITSHPQALTEARELIAMFNERFVKLITSPALDRQGRAQVHVTAEGAVLRDVVDTLDRAGFL